MPRMRSYQEVLASQNPKGPVCNYLARFFQEVESEHRIRIIHISECSSRTWGFAEPDSDYDIRFVYVKLPWAEKINDSSDTMRVKLKNKEGIFDCQGFSIEHFLRKVSQSSLTMYEIMEGTGYYATSSFSEMMHVAVLQYTSIHALMDNCRGLMRKNFEFVKPFDAKHMLHSLRFALMAETLKAGEFPSLRLPSLLALSLFSNRMQEILNMRQEKVWIPDKQVSDYLYYLCHQEVWPPAPKREQRDDRWFNDLNDIYSWIIRQVSTQNNLAFKLNWLY